MAGCPLAVDAADLIFVAARSTGRLAELEAACSSAAFRGAVEQGLLAPLIVFVNVNPKCSTVRH